MFTRFNKYLQNLHLVLTAKAAKLYQLTSRLLCTLLHRHLDTHKSKFISCTFLSWSPSKDSGLFFSMLVQRDWVFARIYHAVRPEML